MWTDLRSDIERARKELGIRNEDFKPVSLSDWKGVQDKIESTFVDRKHLKTGYNWYWSDFKLESHSIRFDSNPYQKLDKIVAKDEAYWFFVNETVHEKTKFWFYEGTIQAIQEIIGETVGLDEYYIASKKYDWLLCVNHHDTLIGTGKKMVERLKELESEIHKPLNF